jgi:hypothetical protein
MFDDFESVEQRMARYLQLSQRAREKAELMPTSDLREGYLKLARDWRALAEDVERKAGLLPKRRTGRSN